MNEQQPLITNQPTVYQQQPTPNYSTGQVYPQQQAPEQDQGGLADCCNSCFSAIGTEYDRGNIKKYARWMGLATSVLLLISAFLELFSFGSTIILCMVEFIIATLILLMEAPFLCKCHETCIQLGESLSTKPLGTKGAVYCIAGALGFVLFAFVDHTTFIGVALAFTCITGILYCVASTKPGDALPQYQSAPVPPPKGGSFSGAAPPVQTSYPQYGNAAATGAAAGSSSAYGQAPVSYTPQPQQQQQPQPTAGSQFVYDTIKNNPELAARAAQSAYEAAANNPQLVQSATSAALGQSQQPQGAQYPAAL
eukprot:Rmarinus@m.4483